MMRPSYPSSAFAPKESSLIATMQGEREGKGRKIAGPSDAATPAPLRLAFGGGLTKITATTPHLQHELLRAKEEIRCIKSIPFVIGQFSEMIDVNYDIVSSTAGSNYYVRILSTLDREMLKPNTSIALHRHSHSVVDILPPESDSTVQLMSEKPDVTYKDIGGMDVQKQEVREAIELPLIQHHLYQQIGIDPPRGVLLYGPPGTGESRWHFASARVDYCF